MVSGDLSSKKAKIKNGRGIFCFICFVPDRFFRTFLLVSAVKFPEVWDTKRKRKYFLQINIWVKDSLAVVGKLLLKSSGVTLQPLLVKVTRYF